MHQHKRLRKTNTKEMRKCFFFLNDNFEHFNTLKVYVNEFKKSKKHFQKKSRRDFKR